MPGLDQTISGAWPLLPGAAPAAVRLVYDEDDASLRQVEPLDAKNRCAGEAGLDGLLPCVPCFTPGALIVTGRGECPVEELRPGDRVVTRDSGVQTVLWTGACTYGWRDLGLLPVLRPVLIRAGALGRGLPARDLLLSPNHRLLVQSRGEGGTVAEEGLVAAADLVGRPGIDTVAPVSVSYLQVLFSRHEAILADGVWTESFRPGAASLAAMSDVARAEVLAILPDAGDAGWSGPAPVRPEVSGRDVLAFSA
ncbi:Hint domain-containing protein [Defluviimonas sp. SAOS-178_SWC]|uniref:Hint domain-containing protein n=1 Tax=Defluviimonas sp. SAOS-178_SWC TaxID=3121287 RepID=UPI0032220919